MAISLDEVTATASLSAQSSASLVDGSVVHVDSVASEPKTGMGYLCNESLSKVTGHHTVSRTLGVQHT